MNPSNYPREEPPKPPPPRKQVPNWLSAVVIIVFAGMCFLMIWPVEGGTRAYAIRTAALSNAKQLGTATLIYAESADDRLPIADRWMDLISPEVKTPEAFYVPGKRVDGAFGYAFRSKLSSVRLKSIEHPETTAQIFNSKDRRWNANGDLDLLPNPPELTGKNVIYFADGRAKVVPSDRVVVR